MMDLSPVFLCTLVVLTASPALAAEDLVPVQDLQTDVAILRSAFEQLHPGLYRYNTKAQMDAHLDLLAKELSRPQPRRDVFLAFARFTAKIKCGHTYPNFYNQTQAIANALFGGQTRVPFEFTWMGGEMVVTRNMAGNPGLGPGARITAINGVSTKRVRSTLLRYARADGSNDNKRLADLSVTGVDRLPDFDVYYPLLFPLRHASYRLTLGNGTNIQVAAWTLNQRIAALKTGSVPEGDQPVWESSMLDEDTAYLRMGTWALYDSKWKWKDFLNEFLDGLVAKGTPKLIIDLRGNEGGLDCGNVILSRLIEKDLPLSAYQRKVRYRKTPENLNQYLDTWDRSSRDWGADAVDDQAGFFRLADVNDGDESTLVLRPRGPRFAGKVVVLMDASNSSATFQFEETVKRYRLATLIGQPAGGNLRGINGGAFFFLRLPKSGIEVDLPLIGRFPSTKQPDGTLSPDVYIQRHLRDLVQGANPELAAARRQ
jgi:hypothetical protein